MIKVCFFDIDGTLLSHKTGQVPASTTRALRQLREKGIKTVAVGDASKGGTIGHAVHDAFEKALMI